jgi:hypothetical protein
MTWALVLTATALIYGLGVLMARGALRRENAEARRNA